MKALLIIPLLISCVPYVEETELCQRNRKKLIDFYLEEGHKSENIESKRMFFNMANNLFEINCLKDEKEIKNENTICCPNN